MSPEKIRCPTTKVYLGLVYKRPDRDWWTAEDRDVVTKRCASREKAVRWLEERWLIHPLRSAA